METVIIEGLLWGARKYVYGRKLGAVCFAVQHNQSSAKASTGAPLSNLMLLRCAAHNVLLS